MGMIGEFQTDFHGVMQVQSPTFPPRTKILSMASLPRNRLYAANFSNTLY